MGVDNTQLKEQSFSRQTSVRNVLNQVVSPRKHAYIKTFCGPAATCFSGLREIGRSKTGKNDWFCSQNNNRYDLKSVTTFL